MPFMPRHSPRNALVKNLPTAALAYRKNDESVIKENSDLLAAACNIGSVTAVRSSFVPNLG